jgi:hypothetical protein
MTVIATPPRAERTTVNDGLARRLFDRRMFLAVSIAFTAIVLVGFGRTFYARDLFDVPPLPTRLVYVHGFLMTAWVALFVTQVRLIARQRVRVHRRLGYSAIALAGLIVATGVPVAVRAAKYGSASKPLGVSPLAFLAVPIFDLLMFVLLFGGAIYYRKRPRAHKTLMLLTAVNFLPPALGRMPFAAPLGPAWFLGLPAAIALGCVVLEARRYGSLNRVFLAGTILLVCSYPARLMLMSTDAWMTFATFATSFV